MRASPFCSGHVQWLVVSRVASERLVHSRTEAGRLKLFQRLSSRRTAPSRLPMILTLAAACAIAESTGRNPAPSSRSRAISVPNRNEFVMKLRVPSIGSRIQRYRTVPLPRALLIPHSSPKIPCSGKFDSMSSRIFSSAALSAAVTGVPFSLSSIAMFDRNFGMITEKAVSTRWLRKGSNSFFSALLMGAV